MNSMKGEVMPDVDEARARARRIRLATEELVSEVTAAYLGRDWEALDYPDWPSYLRGELADLQFTVEQRQHVEQALHAAGMSTRAIAATTGQDHTTVSRHLNTESEDVVQNAPRRDSEEPEPPPVVIDSRGRVQPAHRPVAPPPQMQSAQEAQADPVGLQISENMAAAELVTVVGAYARDAAAALRHVGPLANGTRMHLEQVVMLASTVHEQVITYLKTGVSPLDAEIEDLLGGNEP